MRLLFESVWCTPAPKLGIGLYNFTLLPCMLGTDECKRAWEGCTYIWVYTPFAVRNET